MLLAIDIGNSQTVIGLFDKDRIVRQWRITSQATRTADECALLVSSLMRDAAARVGDPVPVVAEDDAVFQKRGDGNHGA